MSTKAFVGADLILPHAVLMDHALVVRDGFIDRVVPCAELAGGGDVIELQGGFIAPGFIDVQVNGGGGVLLNDAPTIEGIKAIAKTHQRFGTTGMMPTLISDDIEKIDRVLDAVEEAAETGLRQILGIHLEGPYLNPAKRGIHDSQKIRAFDDRALERLTRKGAGRRMVTLAPELVPPGTIAELSRAGILVCAGHSLASYEQIQAALAEGLAGFTHLFNAMSQLTAREPGVVGAALESKSSMFGLIADGQHVHPAVMRLAIAARGSDGVMLVTDAMPTVGSASAHFRLGDAEIRSDRHACRAEDGTLAGSNLDMSTAFRNAITLLQLDIVQASCLASTNPARFLGISGLRGEIAPGASADVIHLDQDLRVKSVWLEGTCVWPEHRK